MSVRINLFVSWYNSPDANRAAELLKILELNKRAHIFLVSEQAFKNIPLGVEKIKVGKRPTYTDMFSIANKYADENTISIIANADIEFDATCLSQISRLDYKEKAYALTRWEKNTLKIAAMNGLTQDAWIFKGVSPELQCDIELGKPSCDHVICYAMSQIWDLRNPSLDIKIWHYDSQKTYKKQERVRGKYLALRPTHINQSAERKKKKKLLIIQPGHFGDIIICLPIAKHYADKYEVFWSCPIQYHELFKHASYCTPVDAGNKRWRHQDFDVILDLSFGFQKGGVDDWWHNNIKRFSSFIDAKYELADVPVEKRWNLEIKHDRSRELNLFKRLGLAGKKYALCHEQSNYNKKTVFNTSLHKVLFRPVPGYTIFDWYEVIMKASEIHCIDSSLANYIEVLPEAKDIPKTIAEGINGKGVFMSIYNNGWKTLEPFKWKRACDIAKNGVVIAEGMKENIKTLISEYEPKVILETGTHIGTGSTRAILDALHVYNVDAKVISIECNPDYVRRAEANLANHPKKKSLQILNGLSVPENLLPNSVTYDGLPENIIVDHYNPNEYLKETQANDDDLISKAIAINGMPDMVILDSAGHMGTIEFDYLMSLVKSDFILAIDDTKHFKHYKTLEKIKADKRFKILKEGSDKFGFAICSFSASEDLVDDARTRRLTL